MGLQRYSTGQSLLPALRVHPTYTWNQANGFRRRTHHSNLCLQMTGPSCWLLAIYVCSTFRFHSTRSRYEFGWFYVEWLSCNVWVAPGGGGTLWSGSPWIYIKIHKESITVPWFVCIILWEIIISAQYLCWNARRCSIFLPKIVPVSRHSIFSCSLWRLFWALTVFLCD